MYCPECGVEYRSGFTQCSDCLVPLIPQKPRRTRERVTVLEGNDPAMIASAQNLFRESGIPFYVWQEESGGGSEQPAPSLDYLCGLEVPLDCEDQARALLQSFERSDLAEDVQEQKVPEADPYLELVTVLEGNNPLMIASAKSVLKKAGIPFYVYGEELGLRYGPVGSFLHPWCRIQVATDRLARAQELVKPFECGKADEVGPEERPESEP